MKVALHIRWALGETDPRAVEETVFRLLAAIGAGGSLRSAAADVGVSYRHAWGLLAEWEKRLGCPLVTLERGRGARLAPLGAALLKARDRGAERLAPALRRLAAEVAGELADLLPPPRPGLLRMSASHSLVVEALRDLAAGEGGGAVGSFDLHVCGSIEALRRFHAGECDLAGFHVPAGRAGDRLARHYRRWLDPERHRLVRVVTRRQGLMTAPGNPKGITSVADLARPGVRFVNRQPESGTRLLFDDLLARAGVSPAAVNGYRNEEFTHTAVASMVKSGAVDAGFGVAAAADRFQLAFVPLAREHYFFALRRDDANEPRVAALRAHLHGVPFRRIVTAMPDYDAGGAGTLVAVEAAFGTGPRGRARNP